MKYVIDYVLVGVRYHNGRVILLCAKYSRLFPSFGFLNVEESYSFSEEEFEALSGISSEKFEKQFETDYFLRLVRVDEKRICFKDHIALSCDQFTCSRCKTVKAENEMATYRRIDHSGICRECSYILRK